MTPEEIEILRKESPNLFRETRFKETKFFMMQSSSSNSTLSNSSTSSMPICNSSNSSCSSISNSSLSSRPSSTSTSSSLTPCDLLSISSSKSSSTPTSVASGISINSSGPPNNESSSTCPCSCTSSSSSSASSTERKRCLPTPNPPPAAPKVSSGCQGEVGSGDPYEIDSNQEINSDGTGACITENKSTNALGNLGPLNFAVTREPFKIESCDQVIVIEGETLKDYKDYNSKTPAWFTLSVYMINMLGERKISTVKNHILLHSITHMPTLILGAPKCIDFIDVKKPNRIIMCLKTESLANQILEAYSSLLKCRMNLSLKKMSARQLSTILKTACLGKEINLTGLSKLTSYIKPYSNDIRESQDEIKAQQNETYQKYNINPVYSLKTPGSLRRLR